MNEFPTSVAGIPCIARITSYSPYRNNMRGHIDDWLPDDPEEIEFDILDQRGRPAPWLERKVTDQDRDRIASEFAQYLDESLL